MVLRRRLKYLQSYTLVERLHAVMDTIFFIAAIVVGAGGFVATTMAAVLLAKLLLYLSATLVIISLAMGLTSRT